MTVNVTDITSGPYAGNDVADTFSYDFTINFSNQLTVYETDAAGVTTTLVLNSDYSVTGVGDNGGGAIVRTAGALPTGRQIYIRSNYQAEQLTDFESQGGFFPDVHETAFDKLTYLILQLKDIAGRALRFSNSYTGGASPIIPDPEGNHVLMWDSLGQSLVNTRLPGIGTINSPYIFDSLRELLNSDLSATGLQVGDYLQCTGRVDANDGGGRTYKAVSAGSDVNYETLIPLTDDLSAELISGTRSIISNSEIEIAAHRGFTDFNVEGSMYAFSSALNYGANSLECDVQVTSDGYLVLFHDKGDTSALLNNITGAISANTYAQVQAATYKELAGNILEDKVQLTTFGELLDFVQLTGCRLHAEIKDYRTQADIDLMLAEVVSRDLEENVVFHSFIFSDIEYVRNANKKVKVSFLSTNLTGLDPEGYDIEDAFDWLKRDKWAMAALSINAIDFDVNGYNVVKDFQEAGVEVAAWTAENGIDFLFARRNNVNVIIADLPYAYNQPLRINNVTRF